MKKLLFVLVGMLMVASLFSATLQPQIPAKLFDVRNGNGVVDTGVTYPQATTIVFKDNASKAKVIDAFATAYGYQAKLADGTDNPQSKQAFYNSKLQLYLKDVYKSVQLETAKKTAGESAASVVDAELP